MLSDLQKLENLSINRCEIDLDLRCNTNLKKLKIGLGVSLSNKKIPKSVTKLKVLNSYIINNGNIDYLKNLEVLIIGKPQNIL